MSRSKKTRSGSELAETRCKLVDGFVALLNGGVTLENFIIDTAFRGKIGIKFFQGGLIINAITSVGEAFEDLMCSLSSFRDAYPNREQGGGKVAIEGAS